MTIIQLLLALIIVVFHCQRGQFGEFKMQGAAAIVNILSIKCLKRGIKAKQNSINISVTVR